MRQTAHGSVLLIVILVLSVMVVWATTILQETLYFLNFSTTRQRYEQQFRLTESLLEYGMAATKLCYKRWKKNSCKQIICKFAQWPPEEKNSENLNKQADEFAGTITIALQEKKASIQAQLHKKNVLIFGLHCTLAEYEISPSKKDGEIHFIVQEWAVDVV
jgi:hypothetical protein